MKLTQQELQALLDYDPLTGAGSMITQDDIDAFTDNDQTSDEVKIKTALDLAIRFGGIDGAHHKDWVIDQMVRILAGDGYGQLVKDACDGEDGPETYSWEVGIAP